MPVLWDKERGTIVNNESRELLRMFDHEFGTIAKNDVDYCPEDLREEVDRVIGEIYTPINNGVYRTGFAGTQSAYAESFNELFDALARWERVLGEQRYLCGGPDHRGRLVSVHHARKVRPGLPRPLQVQPVPHRGLPEPLGLPARPLSAAGVAE